MSPTARRRLGDRGEERARHYLEEKGYRFVSANWHCPVGEIDLVMRDGDEVVFVEVKTRRGEGMGRAEDAVTAAKGERLLAAGEWFLAGAPALADAIWRIDLVAITLDGGGMVRRLTHIVNAVSGG